MCMIMCSPGPMRLYWVITMSDQIAPRSYQALIMCLLCRGKAVTSQWKLFPLTSNLSCLHQACSMSTKSPIGVSYCLSTCQCYCYYVLIRFFLLHCSRPLGTFIDHALARLFFIYIFYFAFIHFLADADKVDGPYTNMLTKNIFKVV